MNCNLPTKCRALVALFAVALLPTASADAQSQQGYQSPHFAGMAMQAGGGAVPGFPSSPLAGGPTAARGDDFMNVNGESIVMPASYCQTCPGGYGGACQCGPGAAGGMGGYGDPMAIDFGGYGQEQCGPHYFDVSADVVFLQATELFDGIGAFSSAGAGTNAPRYLSIGESDEYNAGWQIAGRYDIGALSLVEVAYMGVYDLNFSETVRSVDVVPGGAANGLFTPFSNFGIDTLVNGFDDGNVHSLNYQSDLQSTEISFRRYWVGNNPRVSGTWLMGARYFRMTEDFNFRSEARDLNSPFGPVVGNRLWASENEMVGFQLGGDGWITLRQGLRVGGETKAGIYNNHFKFRHAATLPSANDFDTNIAGDQVAFAAESTASVVVDILPSWSVRGSYRVMYLSSLAAVGSSIDQTDVTATAVNSQGHALFHGFTGGVEYVW